MKKFFDEIISKFKEFWEYVGYLVYGLINNKKVKKISSTSFIFNENLVEERYFDEDSGDFYVRTKYCLCVKREIKVIKNKTYNLTTYDHILKIFDSNYKYNSDYIDIYFWLYSANKSIFIKKKRVIIEFYTN